MSEYLAKIVDLIIDTANKNDRVIHWIAPDCDPTGNSILLQTSTGKTGMVYYNDALPSEPIHYYILDVDLYSWAVQEGFTDEHIFINEEFSVLERTSKEKFIEDICR